MRAARKGRPFRRARNRTIAFGIMTTVLPLALGTKAGLAFGYPS